jgi:hypothetical protein
MKPIYIQLTFAEHISLDRVTNMMTFGANAGNVRPGESSRQFIVEISRLHKFEKLKATLISWERYGFVRWSEISS